MSDVRIRQRPQRRDGLHRCERQVVPGDRGGLLPGGLRHEGPALSIIEISRQVRKSAAACLLSGRIDEKFDAIVTGAGDKGTWVRILRPPVEGKLVHGAEGLDVGDKIRVKLVGVDVDRGFIDFVRA